jgi:hypothetical protein
MTGLADERAAAEALKLSRLAERLSASVSVMREAANAIRSRRPVALGEGIEMCPTDFPPLSCLEGRVLTRIFRRHTEQRSPRASATIA